MSNELVNSFLSELRRSTIPLAVLGVLQDAEYGYVLITKLADIGINVEADTLYPLLRRLESQGLLKGEWNTDSAKPRKYYCRTKLGNEVYQKFYNHWKTTVQSINKIKEREK